MAGPVVVNRRPSSGAQPPPLSFDALKDICEDQVPKICSGLNVADDDVKFVISDLCKNSALDVSRIQGITDLMPSQTVLNENYQAALKKQLTGAKCKEIEAKVLERKQASNPPKTAPAAESSMLDTTSQISPWVYVAGVGVGALTIAAFLTPIPGDEILALLLLRASTL